MILNVKNLEQMDYIGKKIGEIVDEGTIICLEGDLGAGKTTLTQSIARGMLIDEYVTSPTFTVIKEYKGRLNLYHMDAYRLSSEDEMYDLGFEEYINSKGVCVIEWASRIENIIPEEALKIKITQDYSTNERQLHFSGKSGKILCLKEGLEHYENTGH